MATRGDYGLFVPTTNVWDSISELYNVDIKSKEFKDLLVRLYQDVNRISLALNAKDSALYDTTEFVDGQFWFNPTITTTTTENMRQNLRMVVNFGALPNTGIKSVAHGITVDANTSFTRIYGVATKPTLPYSYIPLPYVDVTGANIQLDVNATHVNITTMSDRTAYTVCYVVLEYLIT